VTVNARDFGNELLTKLLTYLADSVPGVIGAGLSIASGGDGDSTPPHSVAAVGLAADLDRAQWAQGVGPIWEAFRTGRLVVHPQRLGDPALSGPATDGLDWHDRAAAAEHEHDGAHDGVADSARTGAARIGMQSLSGISPGTLGKVCGVVFSSGEWGGELPVILSIYLDIEPTSAVLREIDRHEPLVTQALAVVEYCAGEEMLAEQMLQMNQYRRVIEQAKGLVMGATGSDASAAFATLARASQHFNIRLRHLAVALVEHVSGAAAEHPDDPDLVIDPSRADRVVAGRVWAALNASAILTGTPKDPVNEPSGPIPRIDAP
jgi:ANTAR domain-containing protein